MLRKTPFSRQFINSRQLRRLNADARFMDCDSTCVQYDWGKQDNYDNAPSDTRHWIQLLSGMPIYGFGTSLQVTEEQTGMAFASRDPRTGQPVTLLTTLEAFAQGTMAASVDRFAEIHSTSGTAVYRSPANRRITCRQAA